MNHLDFRGWPLQVGDKVVTIRRSYNGRARLIEGELVKFTKKRIHVKLPNRIALQEPHSVMKIPT